MHPHLATPMEPIGVVHRVQVCCTAGIEYPANWLSLLT